MINKKAQNLLLMATMMQGFNDGTPPAATFSTHPATPPVPNGCKQYWFDVEGNFSTFGMKWDDIVYKCVASSDKRAKEKFKKRFAPTAARGTGGVVLDK